MMIFRNIVSYVRFDGVCPAVGARDISDIPGHSTTYGYKPDRGVSVLLRHVILCYSMSLS
jgi:hypothetical protein